VTKLVLLDIVPTYDMWNRLTPELALKTFPWSFLAQAFPWPEQMIGRDPAGWVDHKLTLWGGTGDLSIFDPQALDAYRAAFSDPARLHATCEDYRAGATCDLAADEADFIAGNRIICPTAVFWGENGIPAKADNPVPIWKEWCENITGHPIASGHFLAEENPEDTARAILDFLA
jgi:haloacetate dehalogenase